MAEAGEPVVSMAVCDSGDCWQLGLSSRSAEVSEA